MSETKPHGFQHLMNNLLFNQKTNKFTSIIMGFNSILHIYKNVLTLNIVRYIYPWRSCEASALVFPVKWNEQQIETMALRTHEKRLKYFFLTCNPMENTKNAILTSFQKRFFFCFFFKAVSQAKWKEVRCIFWCLLTSSSVRMLSWSGSWWTWSVSWEHCAWSGKEAPCNWKSVQHDVLYMCKFTLRGNLAKLIIYHQ